MGLGIGNYGDATMFSFHATKVFNSIEGGAIAFKDKRYGVPLHELKNFGMHTETSITSVGANAKLDEFRSAMGICNLRRIDECIEDRHRVHDQYVRRLSGIEGIKLVESREGVTPNYAYFPVYFDKEKFGKSRDDVYMELREHDIYTRKYFYPAINELDCYKDTCEQVTPIAQDVSLNILTLPIYEGLAGEDVDRICDIMLSGRGC